jgi:starvation-inducible DNA-binding protein
MFATKNDLTKPVRTKIIATLAASLADAIDLQTQCKAAHWNVKGPQFIALHKLFDEVNEAIEEHIDNLAERLVQLGGVAEGTARVVAKRSRLPEYPVSGRGAAVDGMDHVAALGTALAAFAALARKDIDACARAGDAGTADLYTEISRDVDKWLWFVEAHAQA